MNTARIRRVVVAGVATLAVSGVVVGCGSSGSTSTAAGQTTAAGTTAAGTAAAAAGDASTAAAANTPAPTTAAPANAGGGNSSKFCKELAAVAASASQFGDDSDDTAGDLKTEAQEFESIKGPVLSSAPGAIKPDITTLFNFLDQYYTALSKVGYDPSKLDPSVLAGIAAQGDSLETASDNVTAYVKTTCGIDLDSEAPSAS